MFNPIGYAFNAIAGVKTDYIKEYLLTIIVSVFGLFFNGKWSGPVLVVMMIFCGTM